VVGGQYGAGVRGGLQVDRLDQPGQEPPDLGVGGHEAFMERVGRRPHQGGHGAHRGVDPGPLGAQPVEHPGQRLHPGVQLGDRPVVVAQFAGAAFLPAVGRRALQVAEHDVEDVDDVVAGAAGEHVGVGQQGRDPTFGAQVGQLGGPGLIGVAGQRRHPSRRQPGQVEVAGAQSAHVGETFERVDQPGDGGTERGAAQPVQFRAA